MNNNINTSPKKKTIKRKFNIIDFLVIIIVIAIIGLSVYAVFSWSNIKKFWSNDTVKLGYTVELKNVDQDFISKIKEKDIVTDAVTKNQLGEVDSIDNTEKYWTADYTKEQKIDENGESTIEYAFVKAEHPDKYNVKVVITSYAEYEEGIGYTINGKRIAVGEAIDLRFPEYSATGYCISVFKLPE